MLVVKIGGGKGIEIEHAVEDLAGMVRAGQKLVLVHGASGETNVLAERLGKPPRFVTSVSGPKGGFQLARDPGNITLLDIVVAIDGPVIAIVALAMLATCGSAFFYPAIGAYIPALVRDERELAPEFKGNGYIAKGVQRMPRALYEAIWELERSKAAVEIFCQEVVDHYLNAARVEQEQYDSVVHDWERERYLDQELRSMRMRRPGPPVELDDETLARLLGER